jgi:hypothetical protein
MCLTIDRSPIWSFGFCRMRCPDRSIPLNIVSPLWSTVHIEGRQESYQFIDIDALLDDFFRDIEQWRKTHEDRDV